MKYFKNAFALIIGINAYQHVSHLNKAVNDAEDIDGTLGNAQLCGYRSENVHLLTNENSDRKIHIQTILNHAIDVPFRPEIHLDFDENAAYGVNAHA